MDSTHDICGSVEHGDRRGRELGFPTANIDISHVSPGREAGLTGVWAGWVKDTMTGATFISTVSVGRRPTFYDHQGPLLVEAFLLDFAGDLYGRELQVHLDTFIRGQQEFTSLDELIVCMEKDVAVTRAYAAAEPARTESAESNAFAG
ncbi:riboflavin kinase [Corynebacterium sp. AOP40-9SA-29]|uniref:riboflavin kinase n=1 Tax=Corynebacterium sp. AOP40-9SA-29 TaxID=3457677 RepID=UPI0040349C70